MIQNEIKAKERLLDDNGNIANPGYCIQSNYIYKRGDIKAHPMRIKEWDFYQISDKRYTLQMVIFDISMGGAATFTLFDRQTGERFEAMTLDLLTLGSYKLPECDEEDHIIHIKKKGFDMKIDCFGNKRILTFKGKCKQGVTEAKLELTLPEGLEYLVMAVPFKEDKHFYLNKKINCMPAKGYVKSGNRTVAFDEDTAFGVLDWGRGVWPYKCDWFWGNGSTKLPDGRIFGFEIGWGFGEMTAFTENTLFIDGKAHKIENLTMKKDEKDYLKPWVFTSSDGRFEMTMVPEFDNYTSTRVGVVGNKCHQVFGKWSGFVILDSGEKLEIKDMIAFCEHSDNRW